MRRHITSLALIFACTSLAWMILGGTVFIRSDASIQHLQGKVASTWGTAQMQSPPIAAFGTLRQGLMPLEASRVRVNLRLNPRQKGLLWYSTYAVDFAGDYSFRNETDQPQTVVFRLPFPAQKAVYDGLQMTVNGLAVALTTDERGMSGVAAIEPGETAKLGVAYRSQGLDSWRYQLGDGISQARDFQLTVQTNFRDVDFADDTLSPTSKEPTQEGWKLTWQYSNLVSGFQIGMIMPAELQPGPLAGEISFAAPVSLFFFFFLMFILTTLRGIDLHPMNYFFLATAFFAFHLLLAYLVDHISIHAAMAIAALVSVFLVVSYLRLVVGMRFAALAAGGAQMVYLVLFSYAFFWKGFTGLSITIIAVVTLFVVMQATGGTRWSEKFAPRAPLQGAQAAAPMP